MASNNAQLANLQDKKHFPGFEDLSWDNQLELDYYRQRENGFWEPRKHWIFIGEIVEVDIGFRVKLTVKDRDGLEIPIAIYTESRGLELGASNLQAGNTVIFPISLDDMMKLSDKIQTQATLADGMRTCHGCNEKSSKLLKCAKCDFFWYCGHNCQLYGWKEKGHKEDCKILRDGNFKGLFSIKWDEFHNHISFPLRSLEE
ncbi:SET domain-containing protein [Fusarium bulbicola]|nr:SET domain-containing protein [Fusarium bulbicola]